MEDTIRRNASPIREGGDRERIGGSNSSLNSSASDESGRNPLQGIETYHVELDQFLGSCRNMILYFDF